jgi:hypothetical protein
VAEFLSPRVSSLRAGDVTIQEFCLEIDDPHHFFTDVISLGFGHEVSVGEGEITFLRSVCKEFRNYELFEMTFDHPSGKLDRQQLMARLEFLSGVDSACNCDVGMIASQFYEFAVSDFDDLSFSVLHSILSDPTLVLQTEDSLFEIIHRHASQNAAYIPLLEFLRFEFLSDQCMRSAFDFLSTSLDFLTLGIWEKLGKRLTLPVRPPPMGRRFAVPSIESSIISECPAFCSRFHGSELQLLYRGSRDGFQSTDFHRFCNGHSPTLTVVLSTDGYVFGGYTPLAWNSRGQYVPDPGLNSFLFTIQNPHNLEPQIFKQKEEACAIYDHASYGPTFGVAYDFYICNQCNSQKSSHSCLGSTYMNDTGREGNTVLTGSQNFLVKEIEVFEVKERT